MKKIEVAAAAIIDHNHVLITKRKGGDFDGLWEFPGGKIEPKESQKEAVVREIKEELRFDVIPKSHLTTIQHAYPNFHLTMHVYICEVKSGKPTLTEHADYQWVSSIELDTIDWLPADISIIPILKYYLKSHPSIK